MNEFLSRLLGWFRRLFGGNESNANNYQSTSTTVESPPEAVVDQDPELPGAHPIIYGKRDSLSVGLNVLEGTLPDDMYGYMYWTVPGGSVNSGGLPYPEYYTANGEQVYNREFGSPLMVSDGMMYKLAFGEGQAMLHTKLMQSPCLIADNAVRRDGPALQNDHFKSWGFINMGMIRPSLFLGLRNLLNTAIVPFRFDDDDTTRTLVTYDLGRPFEMDPDSLSLMTPVGGNDEWKSAMPSLLKWPFPMVQSTAHPSFDPVTKEMFTVNYTRSMTSIMGDTHLVSTLMHEPEVVEAHLEKLAREFAEHGDKERSERDLKALLDDPEGVMEGSKSLSDLHIGEDISHLLDEDLHMIPGNEVILMKWDGKQGPLKQWRVVWKDENGDEHDIAIEQCMHQTQFTKDYILLSDSNFKTTMSIMVNNPFPNNPIIDEWLRSMLADPMLPYLQLYIIKRTDLDPESDKVVAVKMPEPIPMESVHYSANYDNPNNELTLFMSVNASACMAEWLRSYDTMVALNDAPVLTSMLGMFAVGTVDINQIGRWVVNAETGEIITEKSENIDAEEIGRQVSKTFYEEGNVDDPANVGAHTWQLGLYTYRNIISATEVVPEIKNLYTLSFGLDPRTLTRFVYDLYKDKEGNTVPAERVKELSAVLQTHALVNIETDGMTVADFYQFDQDVNPRAIQFVPKKTPTPGVEPQRDGYIVCSMNVVANPEETFENRLYRPEIWIFDANNLGRQDPNKGPICKLGHPDVTWGYGLHSVWTEDAVFPGDTGYNIDVKEDIDYLIKHFWLPSKRRHMHQFFDQYVYPTWYDQKPGG